MKLSVVIPAHNEAGSIEETVQLLASTLEAERIEFELLVVDDGSSDGTAEAVSRAKADDARIRCVRSTYPRGFGFAVRAGLEQFTGDAVAIVMADGSDPPQDLVRYHRLLEEGYDCAFGSRFVKGAKVRDYPRFKLVLNRAAKPSSACSSATATTTRRTRSRRIAARSSRQSSLSCRTPST